MGEDGLAQLDKFYTSFKDVRGKVISRLGKHALNKRIVIPKTIVISAESKVVLYTSLSNEEYDAGTVGKSLGLDQILVNHKNVSTETVIGRKKGECSIVLPSNVLSQVETIIMSNELTKELKREKSVVGYSCGNNIFFCAEGNQFLEAFGNIKLIQKEGDI